MAIPVLVADKESEDFTSSVGDTVKLLACQGVCLARVCEVIDKTRFGNDIVIFDVMASIEVEGDEHKDNHR